MKMVLFPFARTCSNPLSTPFYVRLRQDMVIIAAIFCLVAVSLAKADQKKIATAVLPTPPPPAPGYVFVPELSDEFDGVVLDPTKWSTDASVVGWPGRKPGLFDHNNVVLRNGTLELWARPAKRNASWPQGFDNYTTAAVHSLFKIQKGYFEIRWRSGSSGISSSWWFHQNNGSAWTEIDVFETTGVDNPVCPYAGLMHSPHIGLYNI